MKTETTRPKQRRRFSWWLLLIPVALFAGAKLKENSDVKIERDVIYGNAGGEKLLLDVFYPPVEKATPASTRAAVLLVHGGGWSAGDKKDSDDLGRGLARTDYVAFSANYRLLNGAKNRFPSQLDDVQRAVRWIRSRAAIYKIDPQRLGAMGGSAGGHLVSLLGTTDTRDNSDKDLAKFSSRVACVVAINGPADLTAPLPAIAAEDGLHVEELVRNFIGAPRTDGAAYRAASPLFHIDRKTVPFLIFHGDKDTLVPVDQSQRFYKALLKNGTPAELVVFPGEGHGFAKKENNEILGRKTLAFFAKYLGEKP